MNIDSERINKTLTSKQWEWKIYENDSHPAKLAEHLKVELPHIHPEEWEKRFWLGGVFVNGRMVLKDIPIETPCKIEYYEPKYDIALLEQRFPEFDESWIAYQDDDMAVVFKPAGLPCLPNKEQRHYSLKRYLQKHFHSGLHLPSRLDTSTAGLVALSISQRMHGPLQQAFERRKVKKRYLTKISSPVDWESNTVQGAIAKDDRHAILRKVDPLNGKSASTEFLCLSSDESGATLLAKPLSGRTHQIRVHCAHYFSPIIGDNFYNGAPNSSLCLLSAGFCFYQPFLEREISVIAPECLAPEWAAPFLSQVTF